MFKCKHEIVVEKYNYYFPSESQQNLGAPMMGINAEGWCDKCGCYSKINSYINKYLTIIIIKDLDKKVKELEKQLNCLTGKDCPEKEEG